MDGLGQLLGFLGAFAPRFIELCELLFGDQVDRADPFAIKRSGARALPIRPQRRADPRR